MFVEAEFEAELEAELGAELGAELEAELGAELELFLVSDSVEWFDRDQPWLE
jgi:hypothetical protein